MTYFSIQDLLSQNIETLGFSQSFQAICKKQKLYVLQDIVDLGIQHIAHHKSFTIAWFDELMDFLENRHLLHLLNHTNTTDADC
ncbi:hypothetical protein GCM10023231_12630 [Olivibacter ginsenosidimutans]|uniref:Uncharacterized protein n=1 Tax=Olivibacter ginsenosidimutans TaxID=1176537 RepID=A0ABP9ATY5_9SPHI